MKLSSAQLDSNQVAIDTNALASLKRRAGQDPNASLRETAQQFETLFMNMLMKSMRDTIPKDGLLQSSASDMYTGMLDQQLAQKMSARGTGIADMIVKQLSQYMKTADGSGAGSVTASTSAATKTASSSESNAGVSSATLSSTAQGATLAAAKAATSTRTPGPVDASITQRMKKEPNTVTGRVIRFDDAQTLTARVQGMELPVSTKSAASNVSAQEAPKVFVQQMAPHAEAASRESGVPASFMLGQAALESGWGRREITYPDGQTSHNLFGIKAGSGWTGKTVSVTTTEYVGGVATKSVEKFRAYDSYQESFRDYASLISNNPRYQRVLQQGGTVEGFANAMQGAGYATDPRYAEKLTRTIKQTIALKRSEPDSQAARVTRATTRADSANQVGVATPTNRAAQVTLNAREI